MREGWTYKKLDDCCEIEYGTRVVQKKDGGTIYPVYGGGGETFRMDKYNREDCMIVARFAMSPKCVRYVPGKFFLNDSGLSVKAGDDLVQKYLNHHILYYNDEIYHLGKGAAQRNLDVKSFRQLIISIPPKSQQEAIVSELDEINSLLALKREQLQKYDKLAQSLFYEMFGDPVENEKEWEVKKLGDACSMKAGKAIKATELSESNAYPCYGGNGIRGYINKISHTESAPIIGRQGAYCGTVNFAAAPFYATEHAVVVRPLQEMDIYWLYYTLINLKLSRFAKGQAQPGISVGNLSEEVYLPLPPLPLQQQFASRIEQIESQKHKVQAAIEKLETLLASRMQYWFE